MGFTGCEDFLTREPQLEQSTEITLSTYSGLNDATHGAYYYIQAGMDRVG